MTSSTPSAADGVRVWYAFTSDLSPRGVDPAAWLEPAEQARHDRFRGDDDRAMFLLGRIMARTLVGRALGVAPRAWQWREGQRGRPEIAAPPSAVRFNLAHSGGLVVCALADRRDVGVDVEDLQRRRVEFEVVRRYCAPAEIADVEAQGGAWHDRFLRYWTLKEAYLKARGLGIALPLANLDFTAPIPAWTFHLATIADRHLMAVATATTDGVAPEFTVSPFTW